MSDAYFEKLISQSAADLAPNHLALTDFLPVNRLQTLQDIFAVSHGVASVITDPEGNWLTSPSQFAPLCQVFYQSDLGKDRCHLTFQILSQTLGQNRVPAWRSCLNCELVEGGVPLIAGNRHVGNWIIGQVNAINVAQERIEEHAWTHGLDVQKVRSAFVSLPVMSMKSYEQTLNCLAAFAGEVVQQTFRSYFLESELQQARQTEKELRQKGMDLAHTSAEQQQSLRSFAYDLQMLIKESSSYVGEDTTLNPTLSDDAVDEVDASRQMVTQQLQAIRKVYRSVLQAIAGTHATVAGAEREIVQNRLSSKKRRG